MIKSEIIIPILGQLSLSSITGFLGFFFTLPQLLSDKQIYWIEGQLKKINEEKILNTVSLFNLSIILLTVFIGLVMFVGSLIIHIFGYDLIIETTFLNVILQIVPIQFEDVLLSVFNYKLSFPIPNILPFYNFQILILGYILLIVFLWKQYFKTSKGTNNQSDSKTKTRIKYTFTILIFLLPYIGLIGVSGIIGFVIFLTVVCLSMFILILSVMNFYFISFISRNKFQRISLWIGIILILISYLVK